MNHCKFCKFAEWTRTQTGRLSPTGMGKCTWSKTVRIAASCEGKNFKRGDAVEFKGGWIERNEPMRMKCDVFSPDK